MKDRPREEYKDRLKKIIGIKFDTTMIYPLSQFEAAFGHLWGYGKDPSSLTSDEQVLKAKWEECRTNILNTGNQQKRNAFIELDMHDVIWNRYETVFLTGDKDGNRT